MSNITHGLKRAGTTQHEIVISNLDEDFVVVLTILFSSAAVYTVLIRTVTAHRHLELLVSRGVSRGVSWEHN